LTPGFLRSEVMLERFGVSEATWQGAVKIDANYWFGGALEAVFPDWPS
jgi:hypothetical protein